MTNSSDTIAYARNLRRLARIHASAGGSLQLELNPPAAAYLADVIEQGAMPRDYINRSVEEIDTLRTEAEDDRLKAQDALKEAEAHLDTTARLMARARLHYRLSCVAALIAVLLIVVTA